MVLAMALSMALSGFPPPPPPPGPPGGEGEPPLDVPDGPGRVGFGFGGRGPGFGRGGGRFGGGRGGFSSFRQEEALPPLSPYKSSTGFWGPASVIYTVNPNDSWEVTCRKFMRESIEAGIPQSVRSHRRFENSQDKRKRKAREFAQRKKYLRRRERQLAMPRPGQFGNPVVGNGGGFYGEYTPEYTAYVVKSLMDDKPKQRYRKKKVRTPRWKEEEIKAARAEAKAAKLNEPPKDVLIPEPRWGPWVPPPGAKYFGEP